MTIVTMVDLVVVMKRTAIALVGNRAVTSLDLHRVASARGVTHREVSVAVMQIGPDRDGEVDHRDADRDHEAGRDGDVKDANSTTAPITLSHCSIFVNLKKKSKNKI